MSRLAPLALLLACAEDPSLTADLPKELTKELFACDVQEAPMRDWCALAVLTGGTGTGREVYEVCRRMRDLDSRDRCLGLAVAREDAPAPASSCGYALDERWRAWCWTAAARRLGREDSAAAAAACDQAGELGVACAAAVLDARVSAWSQGSPVDLASDMSLLLEDHPRRAFDQELGSAAGRTGRTLGLLDRRAWVCDAFPPGTGRMACEVAFMGQDTM